MPPPLAARLEQFIGEQAKVDTWPVFRIGIPDTRRKVRVCSRLHAGENTSRVIPLGDRGVIVTIVENAARRPEHGACTKTFGHSTNASNR